MAAEVSPPQANDDVLTVCAISLLAEIVKVSDQSLSSLLPSPEIEVLLRYRVDLQEFFAELRCLTPDPFQVGTPRAHLR